MTRTSPNTNPGTAAIPHDPTPATNAEQSAAWNGDEGSHWARHAETHDATNGRLIPPLLDAAAIADGEDVLDIGCGTGPTTRLAAQADPNGTVVGVDLSAVMVEAARRQAAAAGLTNVRFEVGDAQVHPFAPGGFDVVISHFGIMFFDDLHAAFANIGRAVRPGGRIAFACPQAMERCDWYTVPVGALLGRQPTEADAPSRMFSLAEPAVLADVLGAAGFTDVELRDVHEPMVLGDDPDAAADFIIGAGPGRALLDANGGRSDADARRALTDALAPFHTSGGVAVPGATWIVTASKSPEHGPAA